MNVSIVRAGHNLHMSRADIVIVGARRKRNRRAQLAASATTANSAILGKLFTGGYYNKNNRTITNAVSIMTTARHTWYCPDKCYVTYSLIDSWSDCAAIVYSKERFINSIFIRQTNGIGVKVVLVL